MADPRHLLGRDAEDVVARWLTGCGWRITARRQRSPSGGEVDIVAVDPAGALVAIEVRARRTPRTGAAAATVDRRRLTRLGRTLASVSAASGMPHAALRIDLVTVEPEPGMSDSWRLVRVPGIG
jgi:putative endonuclease